MLIILEVGGGVGWGRDKRVEGGEGGGGSKVSGYGGESGRNNPR